MNWAFRVILLTLILAALPAMAFADVFRWTDDAGVTHYTNLKSEVPLDDPSAQVVVNEAARRLVAASDVSVQDPPAAAAPAAPPSDQPAQAQLADAIYDQMQLLNAYLEGLQRGMAGGGPVAVGGSGGSVEINGPLVVGGSSQWPYSYGYGWPAFCSWPYFSGCGWPYLYPGVAVFHRGPFRHLGRLHARPFVLGGMRGFGRSAGRRW